MPRLSVSHSRVFRFLGGVKLVSGVTEGPLFKLPTWGIFLGNQRRKNGCLFVLLADLRVATAHKELEVQKAREFSLELGGQQQASREVVQSP